jgi:hypothetical protein
MNEPSHKARWRKRRLFSRSLSEAVIAATEPLFKDRQQVTLRLMRDWGRIVGDEAAREMQPRKLVYLSESMAEGTLHLDVAPEIAPEMRLRPCARKSRGISALTPSHVSSFTPMRRLRLCRLKSRRDKVEFIH